MLATVQSVWRHAAAWAVAGLLALTAPAFAQSGAFGSALAQQGAAAPQAPKTVTVDIVADRTAATPQADYLVGVRLTHEPGWHTYWTNPGDSGYPPEVTWQLPKHWKITPLGWPLPARKRSGTLTSFIYTDTLLLPFRLEIPWGTPYDSTGTIRAKVEYLACKDICIPGEASVSFRVPVKVNGTPSKEAPLFEATRAQIPEAISTAPITAEIEAGRLRLDFPPAVGRIQKSVLFFPSEGSLIDLKAPDHFETTPDGVTHLYLKAHAKLDATKPLTGTVVADGGPAHGGWAIAVETPVKAGAVRETIAAQPEPARAAAPSVQQSAAAGYLPSGASLTTQAAVLFAFLGGLILNLMPCVFPVLSLKILQLVDNDRRQGALAVHGLTFTAGILLTMGVLAGLLLALRSFGWAIGWGFQLQTPWVVMLLLLLFFAISLNLWGLFEFTAASHLADSRAMRALPTTGPAGSFWTGVLAVIVASPCTAPFMGAALGFAITQEPIDSILIFLSLGLGMAAPWLVLTLVPVWTRLLPRPGAWMVVFKKIMALPMVAAAFWLLWVLSRQVDFYGLVCAVLASGAFSALLWCIGREQFGRSVNRALRTLAIAVTVVCLGAVASGVFDENRVEISGDWQVWSPQAVETAVAEGHPVLVDFTAAWCVTCQYNKATALRTEATDAAAKRLGYVRLLADWTNRDETITKTLNAFGRTGVPLYLLYSTTGKATVLPELLTEKELIAAMEANR